MSSGREYTRLHLIIARAMGHATNHAVTWQTLLFVGESAEYDRGVVEQAVWEMIDDGFITQGRDRVLRWAR
jgi:hypothetical protein